MEGACLLVFGNVTTTVLVRQLLILFFSRAVRAA
jgi:hypothetical protein